MNISLPWNNINDFLLDCGSIRDPIEFSKRVINQINTLIPYDQARLYFINDNGTVYDEYLLGVSKHVVSEYHNYYSRVDNGLYSITKRVQNFRNHYPKVEDSIYDWSRYGCHEKFFQEYVRPYQIRHSFGLGLRDANNTLKCIFSLDRVCDVKYSVSEVEIMRLIRSHLDNLYQNLYVMPPNSNGNMNNKIMIDSPLTSRESEIAELLKRGVTPIHISEKLCISNTTVHKHITNIHAKLNVSTRQELIVKLLSY